MTFRDWAEANGENPKADITGWLDQHPEHLAAIKEAIDSGYSWAQATRFAVSRGAPAIKHDSLRRAVLGR